MRLSTVPVMRRMLYRRRRWWTRCPFVMVVLVVVVVVVGMMVRTRGCATRADAASAVAQEPGPGT